MNKLLDVRVNMHLNNNQNPEVICLFDEIVTDHLIYVKRDCLDDSGYNLLAVDNDIASYYFFSAVNSSGPLKVGIRVDVTKGDRINYFGLWHNNAEAINLWYPEHLVMDARITSDRNEFIHSLPKPGGVVARNVILMLKERNWRVGLVKGSDGFINVEPLLPDGTPKNERLGARVKKIF